MSENLNPTPYLQAYYETHDEDGRLLSRTGQIEFLTTMRYIEKYLKPAGSANDAATAKWLAQIEAAFPGMPILYDDLSMGVSCHTGEGALGIGLSVRPRV